jgi:ParB/RepB/Spo0J family partition protein
MQAMVALDLIDLDGLNPRLQGDALKAAVAAKAESMKDRGQLSPIRLYFKPDSHRFRLGFGHLRYLAAKDLGWKEIRAEVLLHPSDDRDILDARDLENLDHQALNPLEEMLLVEQALARSGGDVQKAAARLHRPIAWVRSRAFVAQLAPEVKDLLAARRLAPDHARELAKLPDHASQVQIAAAGSLAPALTGTLRTPEWFRAQVLRRGRSLTVLPWDPAAPLAGKRPCIGCPHNTATNPMLFETDDGAAFLGQCMNASCFEAKRAAALVTPAPRQLDPAAFAKAQTKWRRSVVATLAKAATDPSRVEALTTLATTWGIPVPPPPKPDDFLGESDV